MTFLTLFVDIKIKFQVLLKFIPLNLGEIYVTCCTRGMELVPQTPEQVPSNIRHGIMADFEPMTVLRGVDQLRDECFKQSKYWAKRDEPAMSALFDALYYESLENVDLRLAMQDSVAIRHLENSDLVVSEVAGVWRATMFGDQLAAGRKPQEYIQRQQWLGPIREVARLVTNLEPHSYEAYRAERLQVNLIGDSVGTSPYTRAAPDELLMQALAPRFPDGFRWLDDGCGMLTSVNQVLYKEIFPFEPVTFFKHPSRDAGRNEYVEDEALTQEARRVLLKKHLVEWCLAVDITDPFYADYSQKWALAALRGGELRNAQFMNTYEGLASRTHPKLTFKKLDLTTVHDTEKLRQELDGDLPNFITLSTFKHQLSEQERLEVDRNALSLLAEGGLLVTKDFSSVSPTKPKTMSFYKHWHHNGRYRTHVMDPALPKLGWQEIFRARDSRCRALTASAGKMLVSGSLKTIQELLHEAAAQPLDRRRPTSSA